MNRIEAGLHAHHAAAAATVQERSSSQPTTAATPAASTSSSQAPVSSMDAPFARVNSVEAGSPADGAGLKAGDKILRFGSATWVNHEKLSKVAQVVSQNEGVSVA